MAHPRPAADPVPVRRAGRRRLLPPSRLPRSAPRMVIAPRRRPVHSPAARRTAMGRQTGETLAPRPAARWSRHRRVPGTKSLPPLPVRLLAHPGLRRSSHPVHLLPNKLTGCSLGSRHSVALLRSPVSSRHPVPAAHPPVPVPPRSVTTAPGLRRRPAASTPVGPGGVRVPRLNDAAIATTGAARAPGRGPRQCGRGAAMRMGHVTGCLGRRHRAPPCGHPVHGIHPVRGSHPVRRDHHPVPPPRSSNPVFLPPLLLRQLARSVL